MRIVVKKQSVLGFPDFIKNQLCFHLNTMQAQDVAASFKEVKSKICNMNGGAGKLQSAVDLIDQRITKDDEPKIEKIRTAGQKLAAFMQNVKSTDHKVAQTIALNQEKFFQANPWAIPPAPPKKKSRWQKFKDGLKKLGKAIGNAFKKAGKWIANTAKKLWKKTKEFCKKHWKAIVKVVVGVVVIAGLAALSVFTGGAAAPLFAVAAKGAAICACTSAATTVVSGVIQGKSFGQIFDEGANSFMIGSITGAVSGFAGAAAGSVTSATGSKLLGDLTKIGIETGGKMLANGASYLIDNGSLKGFMKAEGWGILKEGASGALSAAGGYIKNYGKDLLGKAFGGLSGSQLANSFKEAYKFCENKMPTLTHVVTNSAKETFGSLSLSDLTKLKNPAEFAKSIGNTFIGNLKNNAMNSVGDFVRQDLNNITGGAVDKVVNYADNVVNNFKDSSFGQAVTGAYKDISGAYNQLKNIGSAASGAYDQIKGSIIGEFKNISGNYLNNIGDSLKNSAINYAGSKISEMGSSLSQGISQISQSIAGGQILIGKGIQGVSGALGNVIGSACGGALKTTIMPIKLTSPTLSGVLGSLSGSATHTTASTLVRTTNTTLGFLSKIRL